MNVDNSKVTYLFEIIRQYGAFKNLERLFPKRQIQVQFLVGSPTPPTFYLVPSLETNSAYFPVISPNIPELLGINWGKNFFQRKFSFLAVDLIIGIFTSKFNQILNIKSTAWRACGEAFY